MLNKVILMGRLTADPELRQTPNGVSTCQFNVAVDRGYTTQNGERQTDFITVVAWRQTAEFVSRYFAKGRMIIVEGSLRTRSYADKRYPDVTHYIMEVQADNVQFGETKAAAQAHSGGGNYAPQQFAQPQYSQPAPNAQPQFAPQQSAPAPAVSFGDLGDFEEVIGDGDLPF
ncbi:MAG: single-stranded DNA-binding protein [Oscillospiraceae bacterium]|nr:single-stranded DNA-binding protein [Oscillospiraceae bacterium]